MTEPHRHSYLALDGMRGVAALAVVLHHFPPIRSPALFHNGLLAVDIFYLLSGFVIAHAYGPRLAAGLGTGRFMAGRIIRLWPIMMLGVLVGLLQALVVPVPGKDLALGVGGRLACTGFNLLILPCPPGLSRQMFPANPPEWTLFYELVANLLFALAFALLQGRRALIALIAAGGAVAAAGVLRYQGVKFGVSHEGVPFDLGRVVFSFFLGVLLQRTRPIWARRVPAAPSWIVYLLVLALLAAPQASPTAQTALHLAAVFVLSPLLVMLGAVARSAGLMAKASMLLGRLSYPLYAIHMPLIFLGAGLLASPWDQSILVYLGLLVPALALAMVLPSIYEAPVRRALTAMLGRSLVRGRPAVISRADGV
jgi:peptidoglycan/LPS O-acetylase OafA/YrhL